MPFNRRYELTQKQIGRVVTGVTFRPMAPGAGLEPATLKLTASCSTIELPGINGLTGRLQGVIIPVLFNRCKYFAFYLISNCQVC